MDALMSFRLDFPSNTDVSTQILLEIAENTPHEISDLPIIHESIDCDALDHLIRASEGLSTVIFDYSGYSIAISGDRYVEIWPQGEIPEIQTETE